MKKDQISKVAEKVGVSKSLVSRAVNHCPEVSSDLREKILNAAKEEGFVSRKANNGGEVYVILPDTPAFFWRSVLQSLFDEFKKRDIKAKYNVYSKLGDKAPVEDYLDEAEAHNASAVVICAKYDTLDGRLSELSKKCAVFSFLENTEAKNVFYIGSDRIADGRLLGEWFLKNHKNADRVVIIGNDELRLCGLLAALPSIEAAILSGESNQTAAELARDLNEIYKREGFDAVVCLDGTTARLAIALKKCKVDVPFYGFESVLIDSRYPCPVGEIHQNIAGSSQKLAELIKNYIESRLFPNSKSIYIDSVYVEKH